MRITKICIVVMLAASAVWAQEPAGDKAAFQQKLAEVKEAAAVNLTNLKKYQWLQTTQIEIKGDKKKEEMAQCRYGADGKLQRTPVGTPTAPKEPPGGLKGKFAKKKIEEMKDYTERLKSLIGHYAPPDPQRLKNVAQSGKANLERTAGVVTLTFKGYYKMGDTVEIAYDTGAKKVQSYNINTYLDGPKDIVTMSNDFANLPDGTNFLHQTVLDATEKEIHITRTNSGHSLIPN
jgi:hypothetical protein